jgi:Ran GTPase-activating protein (RanGAP) involved in mRNA processing and transport
MSREQGPRFGWGGMNPMWMDYNDDDEDEDDEKDKEKDKDDDEDEDEDDEDTLQTRPRAVILSAAKDLL